MKFFFLFLIAAVATFAQWDGFIGGKSFSEYTKVSVSGRDVYVYVPTGMPDNSPLLLSLHGMDQGPEDLQQNTHWENVADTVGFVVAYPQGGTGMSTWDLQGETDTKWITEIIDQFAKDYKIDRSRVYLSGFSIGGMFTYYAMNKIADKIAAIAPCSGPNIYGASEAMRPVPIFHIHGTNDDVLNYSMVNDYLEEYRDLFNCPETADIIENYPNSENKATMYSWGPCDGDVYVKHLKLQGRGHSPSSADVSDIWDFVKEYSWESEPDEPIVEPIVVPTDRDSIFNGSFSDSLKLAGWNLNVLQGAATLVLTDGMAEIKVSDEHGDNEIEFTQEGLHLEAHGVYRLTFDAYASTSVSDFRAELLSEGNYHDQVHFDLTSENKTFEYVFELFNDDTDENGSILFGIDLSEGSVFIDNVKLELIEYTTGLVMNRLLMKSAKTYSVYDMKGALVCKFSARLDEIQGLLNARRLDKGLYMVKSGSVNRIFTVK